MPDPPTIFRQFSKTGMPAGSSGDEEEGILYHNIVIYVNARVSVRVNVRV